MLRPLTAIAADLRIDPDHLHPWGPGRAKVSLEALAAPGAAQEPGRLILVSSINPTPAGEGKTVTAIGLAQGLARLGRGTCVALREPSMGPVFGAKGGGTGGGRTQVEPAEDINLHFTGDLHAVTAAHNLLAAAADHRLHFGGSPALDPGRLSWPRVIDIGDRALRSIVTGLGHGNGPLRETGFEITAASEVMAALCLARDEADLRARLGRLLVGVSPDRQPVTADDLQATGAMATLLRHALWPNLVQTTEGVPALVHGGPFANIAHGASSVVATRLALGRAERVVTEAGFGFDLGGEKFLHLVVPHLGTTPSVVVLVVTVRALRLHGATNATGRDIDASDVEAVERGLENLVHHVEVARSVGLPVVVAINRFPADTEEELQRIEARCAGLGVEAIQSFHFADGGAGAEGLAEAVEVACAPGPATLDLPAAGALPPEARIEAIAKRFHGAAGIMLEAPARQVLAQARSMGLSDLPICIAKTQYSLTDDPTRTGRPEGHVLRVRDLRINAGAGFLVALAGEINRMPALPKEPAFHRMG